MNTLNPLLRLLFVIAFAITATIVVLPQDVPAEELPPLSITLEGYAYPYPVSFLPLVIEGQELKIDRKSTRLNSSH